MVEEDKTFEEAYERLKKASSDEKLMAMYRSREKTIKDWNDSINSAIREGELQGKRIRLQEGIKTGQIRTLIDLVNELKYAGAEAISINDIRIINTTDIFDLRSYT